MKNNKLTTLKYSVLFLGTFITLYSMIKKYEAYIALGAFFLTIYEIIEYKERKSSKNLFWIIILVAFIIFVIIKEFFFRN